MCISDLRVLLLVLNVYFIIVNKLSRLTLLMMKFNCFIRSEVALIILG